MDYERRSVISSGMTKLEHFFKSSKSFLSKNFLTSTVPFHALPENPLRYNVQGGGNVPQIA